MTTRTNDWCVLRCAGSSTIKLAESLTEDGYDVWTPVETVDLRARRAHPKAETAEPLMSSYVFARMQHLNELLALSHSPSLTYLVWDSEQQRMVLRGHPTFSLMRGLDTPWATVPDGQLAPLRTIEYRRRPKVASKVIEEGARVRMTEGGYAGLYGEVTAPDKANPMVLIDGWSIPVRIAAWLLHPEVDSPSASGVSGQVSEARAA